MRTHWPILRIALALGIVVGGMFAVVQFTRADDPLEVLIRWGTTPRKKLPSQPLEYTYTEPGCTDTDGSDVYTRGSVKAWPDGGTATTYTDQCVEGSRLQLQEYACSDTTMQTTTVTCAAGCSNGACNRVGTVYLAYTIDTEVRFFNPTLRAQTLDLSDYEPDHLVDSVMRDSFRDQFRDPTGQRVKLSWFFLSTPPYCLSTQANCTAPYDAFAPYRTRAQSYGDQTDAWHYHHQAWSDRNGDGQFFWNQLFTFNGTTYPDGTDASFAEAMLAHVILDKQTYPSVFRTGWAWQNTDISNWFDDVLLFDFSNLAPLYNAGPPATQDNVGNFFNWSRAPQVWSYYHPSSADYMLPGTLKRYQFRTHNGPNEWEKAFQQARLGQDQFVVIATHNYNELITMEALLGDFTKLTVKYPDVPFRYVTALEGARLMADRGGDTLSPDALVRIQDRQVTVTVNEPLFTFPFGAVRTGDAYTRVMPLTKDPKSENGLYSWAYDLSAYGTGATFAAAGSDLAGNTFVTTQVAI